MPGTFSPPTRVSDTDMHHDTCTRPVPWCMPGSLNSGYFLNRWRGNVPGIPGACATRNFIYLVRGPCHAPMILSKGVFHATGRIFRCNKCLLYSIASIYVVLTKHENKTSPQLIQKNVNDLSDMIHIFVSKVFISRHLLTWMINSLNRAVETYSNFVY